MHADGGNLPAEVENKSRSAGWIWLHPVKARCELEALYEHAGNLQEHLDRKALELQRMDDLILREKNRSAEENEKLKSEIQRLNEVNEGLTLELKEWTRTRNELDAIAARMQQWEEIKAGYEEKIKNLTQRLREEMETRQRKSETKFQSDIVEDGESPFVAPEKNKRLFPKDDADWLLTLPD